MEQTEESSKNDRREKFGVEALDFILAHIHKTGDNPDSARAQALRDELREIKGRQP